MKRHALFPVAGLLGLSLAGQPVAAQIPAGTVMVSTGSGRVTEFAPDGTFVGQLDTTTAAPETAGSAFDPAGNFYVTDFAAQKVTKFDPTGVLIGPFGGGYNADPESILFDGTGNVYVGQADGTHQILKFDPSGALLATFSLPTENRGTDHLALAADQCTIFYTSEGVKVKRFNVCTNAPLTDFNTAPLPGSTAFALKLLPAGGLLVADTEKVVRLDSAGNQVQTYALPGTTLLFAVSLDPGGTSFWTADLYSGKVFKIDIESGAILQQWSAAGAPNFVDVAGLSVKGEINVARGAIFYVADQQAEAIFAYLAFDEFVQPVGSTSLDRRNAEPRGVDVADNVIYVLDAVEKQVIKYDAARNSVAVSGLLRRADGSALDTPTGLAIARDDLWVVDAGRRRIFRYSVAGAFGSAATPVNATAELTLDSRNRMPSDAAVGDFWLYVLDEKDRQIYQYSVGLLPPPVPGPQTAWGVSRVMRQRNGNDLLHPTGLSTNGVSAFVVDRGADKILKYDLEDLFAAGADQQTASDEFLLVPANGDARGMGGAPQAQPCQDPEPAGNPVKGITCLHNTVRAHPENLPAPPPPKNNTQPKPNPAIPALSWDAEKNLPQGQADVVTLATNWANRCMFDHRTLQERMQQNIGENLFVEAPPENANAPRAGLAGRVVESWKNEAAFYNHAKNECKAPAGKTCDHYTQMVWEKSQHLGCAAKVCDQNSPFPNFKDWVLVVCEYRQAGNTGGPPY